VWEVLPILETLLGIIERKQEELNAAQRGRPQPLQIAYQNAWEKLQKYYNKTDSAHNIYAAAVLLYPSYRKHYFEKKWATGDLALWREPLYQSVRVTWQIEYCGSTATASEQTQPLATEHTIQEETDPFEAYLADTKALLESDQNDSNAFDAFISATPTRINNDHLLTWWNAPHNDTALKQQALDLFSIPAMSTEIERVFSSTRMLLSAQRQRINEVSIEQSELLRHWWQQGIGDGDTSDLPSYLGDESVVGASTPSTR
jgi:hypothetical protein